MKDRLLILIFAIPILLIWSSESSSLVEETHQQINEFIGQTSINGYSLNDYLVNNIGLKEGAREIIGGVDADGKALTYRVFQWLGYGGFREDRPGSDLDYILNRPTRSSNHFHDPLEENWDFAGLYSMPYFGQSSILWAQNTNQNPGGKWSWHNGRDYFYKGLTLIDKTERDGAMANTFRALGQLMHLIQDASVPAHTRNQIHPFFNYEKWIEYIRKLETTSFDRFIANPICFDPNILNGTPNPLAKIPITKIIDTGKYYASKDPNTTTGSGIGIAEYTNANFFSEHTIFSQVYPYPKQESSVEIKPYFIPDPRGSGTYVQRYYYKKIGDGEKYFRLATVGALKEYITKHFPSHNGKDKPALDGGVYSDYASLLLPRAVGYSAGLLQYFFRGNIEITLPDRGVYAQTDNVNQKFTQVKLKAKNTTPNEEEMTDGSVELVVKFKVAHENPFQSKPVETDAEFTYIVVPETNGVRSIPRDQPQELVFNLTSSPIPLYATDLYLQVVYHGKLGQVTNGSFVGEDLGVAVGFKDISEPTPIDIFNDMDRICLNQSWYVAGSNEALQVGQAHGVDVYPHGLKDSYIRFSSIDNFQCVSSTEYNFYIPLIAPGASSRIFILSDYDGCNLSYTGSAQKIGDSDSWPHLPGVLCPPGYTTFSPCRDVYKPIKNQTDFLNGRENRVYPTFKVFRGVQTWGGEAVENRSYPASSVCPEE